MPLQRNNYIDEPLIDGMLEYGTTIVQRDAQKKEIGRTFKSIGSLWFNYREISDYDTRLYDGLNTSESIKVKTYYVPEIEQGLKVQINGTTYDITGTNADDDRKFRFWLLTRVKL